MKSREQIRKRKAQHYRKNQRELRKRAARRYQSKRQTIAAQTKKRQRSIKGRHIRLLTTLRREKLNKKDPLWSLNFYTGFLTGQICHYCGGKLNPTGHALDAMNSNKKHFCWNVVPCCWGCNKMKRDELSYKEMMLLAPTLNQIQRQRSEAE